MRSIAFLGLLMSAVMVPGTAQAQTESGVSSTSALALAVQGMRGMRGRHYVRHGGNRFYGHRGGHRFYGHRGVRRFHRGSRFFVGGFLPRYFLAPRYYVVNYPYYGLARPRHGYRWVRYYDDAYLVDERGHISDYRYGVSYDGRRDGSYRHDYRYDDRYRDDRYYDDRRRRGDGGGAAVGAIAGGIIGGIAGNRIAGRGNRTEGTIIGGALGAIAGGAIGSAADRADRYDRRYSRRDYYADRRHSRDRHHDSYYYDENAPVPEYVGSGDYYPPAAPDSGVGYEYDDRHDDRVVAPPVQRAPTVRTHVSVNGVTTHATQHAHGITQTATTNIVVNSQPTTTFIEEEVEYVPARRSIGRSGHRRASSRGCNC